MKSQVEEKINSLSMIEQSLQQISTQKQNLQNQLLEIESSLQEIEGTDTVYKIIGNIMVKSNGKSVKEGLEEKKKMITIRITSFDKQENAQRERAKTIQAEIMKELEEEERK